MVDFNKLYEDMKFGPFNIPSGEKRKLPEWLRTVFVTGPLEAVVNNGWQDSIKDSLWKLLEEVEGDPVLAVQQSSISDFILDFSDDLRVIYPNLKVELHKLGFDHLYLPFVPEDLLDIYEEVGEEGFPELLRALSAREGLKWLRKFGESDNKADEIVEYEDKSWTLYRGQGRKKTSLHFEMEERCSNVLQVRLSGDTSYLGGNWWLKKRSGITVMILDLPGNKEAHVDIFYNL